MNFRGSKVFDEYEDDEQNKHGHNDQKVQLSKYVDRDQGADESNNNFNNQNNRKFNNNNFEDNSFIDPNERNINNQQKNMPNNSNNNFSDRISLIKILISNYLKEKELDM